MTTLLVALVLFLEILEYIVIFDVILSWLTLMKINFRPKFIADILWPLYSFVRKYIPTRFWAFDLTPIIVILGLAFIRGILILSFPEVQNELSRMFT